MQEQASGTEGDVITLNLGWRPGYPGYRRQCRQCARERARAGARHPEGVPDRAEIRLPSGVSGTVVDLGGGRWQVTTDGGKLDAVELVTNDANGAMAIKVTAQSLDNGALGPEVNGTIHLDVSPVNDAPSTCCPMIPRWHRRTSRSSSRVCRSGRGCGQRHHGSAPLGGARHPDPAGRAAVTLTGNGTGDVVLTGTLADLNALLAGGVTYQGERDFNGQDALTMVTNDRATPAVVAP